VPDLLSLPDPHCRSPLRQSSPALSGFIVTYRSCFLAFWPFSPSNLPPRHGFCFGFLISLFVLLEFVFVYFGFCFCCFFYLFRYTLWMMILGFHSNFPLHLSVPPISFVCSATHPPLRGFFSRPHHDELSMSPSNFGFQGARDRLFFSTAVIHLVCFYVAYFLAILAGFSF
jgi:hypothetical protein